MKTASSLLFLWLALAASSVPSASGTDMTLFRIGTGGVGGTYYPIGLLIGSIISRPPGAPSCADNSPCGVAGLLAVAQSANGSAANVTDIERGALESGFAQSDVTHWAYTGSGTFDGNTPMKRLRTIASLYPESIHLVARRGAGIRSLHDLRGKRVALDEPGSGTLIDAEILLRAFGLSPDNVSVEYSKFELAAKKIRDGQLDAFFVVTGYPATAISELWREELIELIPIRGPEVDKILRQHTFFSRGEIPADAYPGLEHPVPTINVKAQWLTSSRMDPELIYRITKTLWSSDARKALDQGHPKGREIRLETALEGLAVPLHPGAARFYREQGMLNES